MEIEEVNKLGNELVDLLKLETSPVAVALVQKDSEVPEGFNRIENPTRHCQMINNVRHDGSQFYALVDDHQCGGGASFLGYKELGEALASGEMYFKLKRFDTLESAKRTMEMVPRLEAGSTKAILYAPLDKAQFVPDVIVIITNPKQVMQLSQALIHKEGGRIEASFAGIQSLCADGVVIPYQQDKVSVSVGCGGSRKYAGVEEQEMIIGIPAARLADMVESLKKMFGA